ncbi:hypothetical protein BGZ99_006825 [Dissophora globulifera]|uniref:Uncharacterized protein n=1 Tax=Dissophora globulifera TaxID=979702 RepID=A0A9P6RDF7_9FUNG|nr:hypothetical protein BGZ99_006825 [Dissophora globulifera]
MATIASQCPIALCNPFSLLEPEFHPDSCASSVSSDSSVHTIAEDDALDLSTWCVISSEYLSDDGSDEDEQDGKEIYLWQSGTDGNLKGTDSGLSHLAPLRLSLLSDGFTNISMAAMTHSTNSAIVTAPKHRGAWVVKVNRKRSKLQDESRTSKAETTSASAEANAPASSASDTTASITGNSTPSLSLTTQMNLAEKRKEMALDDATADNENADDDEDDTFYMPLTERELSKSSKAAKIKNSRVATQHDWHLARALGCLTEDTDEVDKKALRSRSSKVNNTINNDKMKSRANKAKLLPSDF